MADTSVSGALNHWTFGPLEARYMKRELQLYEPYRLTECSFSLFRLFLVRLPSIESCRLSLVARLTVPSGITEAFKADKFEKKINLGTIPPRPFERSWFAIATPAKHVIIAPL